MESFVLVAGAVITCSFAYACRPADRPPLPSEVSAGSPGVDGGVGRADPDRLEMKLWPLIPDLKHSAEQESGGHAVLYLYNYNREPVWLNLRAELGGRYAVLSAEPADPMQAHHPEIRCKIRSSPPEPSDYASIRPNDFILRLVSFRCLSREPRPLALRLRYKDANQNPPKPPPGVRAFTGELVSNPVVLEGGGRVRFLDESDLGSGSVAP